MQLYLKKQKKGRPLCYIDICSMESILFLLADRKKSFLIRQTFWKSAILQFYDYFGWRFESRARNSIWNEQDLIVFWLHVDSSIFKKNVSPRSCRKSKNKIHRFRSEINITIYILLKKKSIILKFKIRFENFF